MGRPPAISEEKQKELADRVLDEIRRNKEEKIEFTTNIKLAEVFSVSEGTIRNYLLKLIPDKKLLRYRESFIKKARNSKAGKRNIELHGPPKATKEQRRAGGKRSIELHGSHLDKLTPKELRAARSKGGKRSIELHGSHFSTFSPEERTEIGKKGGIRCIELHGNPSKDMTTEQLSAAGIKGAQSLRRKRWFYEGMHYDSQSEAACAILMKKYIGFEIKEGITYQINEKVSKSIDFLVNDVFFEWHPILPFYSNVKNKRTGDFKTLEEYLEFRNTNKSLEGKEKKEYESEVKEELQQQYWEGRLEAIAQSDYKGKELIVASTEEEFYELVIQRFCTEIPEKIEFLREFRRTMKEVKKATEEYEKQKAKL